MVAERRLVDRTAVRQDSEGNNESSVVVNKMALNRASELQDGKISPTDRAEYPLHLQTLFSVATADHNVTYHHSGIPSTEEIHVGI